MGSHHRAMSMHLTLPPRPASRASRIRPALLGLPMCLLLAACAAQDPLPEVPMDLPTRWDSPTRTPDSPSSAAPEPWWVRMNEPALPLLLQAAESGHPSLRLAAARIDEARATLAHESSGARPQVHVEGAGRRVREADDDNQPVHARSASVGLRFSWELDLFGRLRASRAAARHRLLASDQDAMDLRLALSHEVAYTTVSLRTCQASARVRWQAVDATTALRDAMHKRVQAGLGAASELHRETIRLGLARADLTRQEEECARLVHQLVTLTGMAAAQVRALMDETAPPPQVLPLESQLDAWPETVLPLPATVLTVHPAVRSAQHAVAAAWSDIDSARADRWPRFSLDAMLSREWLSAAGTRSVFTPWLIGPTLTAPLFDGGARAAHLSSAEARYQGALANLQSTLRMATRDIEDSLAAIALAGERAQALRAAHAAASLDWSTQQRRQALGLVSRYELETARLQYLDTQLAALAAARDRALAWAQLVRASGNGGILKDTTT